MQNSLTTFNGGSEAIILHSETVVISVKRDVTWRSLGDSDWSVWSGESSGEMICDRRRRTMQDFHVGNDRMTALTDGMAAP